MAEVAMVAAAGKRLILTPEKRREYFDELKRLGEVPVMEARL